MAYTSLKISVPKPCHEDWNGMTPVENTTARHCDSCAKNVTDFTGFTDAQLHTYARENAGRLCGRFRPDQLERPLRAVADRKASPLQIAAATAGLLLASSTAEAQSTLPVPAEPSPIETKDATLANIRAINAAHLTIDNKPNIMIRGEMVASPLKADTIPQRPPIVGRIAVAPAPPPRVIGKIRLPQPDDIVGDIVIEETPDSLLPEVIIFPTPDTLPPSQELHPMIMGMIMVEPPRPTGIDRIKDSLSNLIPRLPLPPKEPTSHLRPRPDAPYLESLAVSPNPFDRELRLQLNVPKDASLVIELLNANGRLIHSQLWHVVSGDNSLTVEPKRRKLSPGIYFLRLTDFNEFEVVRTVVKR